MNYGGELKSKIAFEINADDVIIVRSASASCSGSGADDASLPGGCRSHS